MAVWKVLKSAYAALYFSHHCYFWKSLTSDVKWKVFGTCTAEEPLTTANDAILAPQNYAREAQIFLGLTTAYSEYKNKVQIQPAKWVNNMYIYLIYKHFTLFISINPVKIEKATRESCIYMVDYVSICFWNGTVWWATVEKITVLSNMKYSDFIECKWQVAKELGRGDRYLKLQIW